MSVKIKELDIDLDDVDPNGLFVDQTLGAAGNFALNGAGVVSGVWRSPDGFAKRIGFESAGNLSGVTLTVTGFQDVHGHVAISETLAGPNANTVETVKYYAIISSVSASAAVGTNIEAGPVDEAISQVIPLSWSSPRAATVDVDVNGTINFTVQETFDDFIKNGVLNCRWDSVSALASKAADTRSTLSVNATAMRVVINSYSSGGEAQVIIIQSRY